MTNEQAKYELEHIYGMVAPDVQRALDVALKAIGELEERPTGEWEKTFPHNGKPYHKCSNCHVSSQLILVDNFCPYCGAKMIYKENDDESI